MKLIKKKDIYFIIGIVVLYALLGVVFKLLVIGDYIPTISTPEDETHLNISPVLRPMEVEARLEAAQEFVQDQLIRREGHVDLYYLPPGSAFPGAEQTNSEAVSYYLLWTAQDDDKESFDTALAFVQEKMLQPESGYMMWRLEQDDTVEGDGVNIASDADLRAIKALFIAEEQWGDDKYTDMIDTLATGIETVAVTDEGYLAPYGGGSPEQPWTADEVWISYEDFTVMQTLSDRRGEPWTTMYERMKISTIEAQIHNGLYNSMITQSGAYGNGIDSGGYGINSLWIMIRNAESDDPELQNSARESLNFYKQKYVVDAQLFALYTSNGDALSPYDSPWVYALVGRAAVELDDEDFADSMVEKLFSFQDVKDGSPLYGSFPEGSDSDLRAGQFTLQESILTLQAYVDMKSS